MSSISAIFSVHQEYTSSEEKQEWAKWKQLVVLHILSARSYIWTRDIDEEENLS